MKVGDIVSRNMGIKISLKVSLFMIMICKSNVGDISPFLAHLERNSNLEYILKVFMEASSMLIHVEISKLCFFNANGTVPMVR